MEKFASQQAALRAALCLVMGTEPTKGSLVITDEQRVKVGEVMMEWYKAGRWTIKEGTRAHQDPLMYITGKRPTDLIQSWTKVKKPTEPGTNASSPIGKIKEALEAGLITQEQANELVMKILAA